MDSLTFTISLKDLDACDGDFDQVVEAIQNFINILHCASPDYYLAGDVLQKQLDEQVKQHKETPVDPREEFCNKLDKLCPYIMSAMQDEELKNLYSELRNQIGEAMGPVSYAAYKLVQGLSKYDYSVSWVWDFVKYYEENWKF